MGILVSPGIGVIAVGMRGAQGATLFGRREGHKGIEHFRVRFWIGPNRAMLAHFAPRPSL
jgi:hypothetical protein